jgi:hypothetical protein
MAYDGHGKLIQESKRRNSTDPGAARRGAVLSQETKNKISAGVHAYNDAKNKARRHTNNG